MQYNVFEPGVTDAPCFIKFRPEFKAQLNTLFQVIHANGEGTAFLVFEGDRKKHGFPLSGLPPAVPLNTTQKLMDLMEFLYGGCYHLLGGNVRLGDAPPSDKLPPPDIDHTLRTLFVRSALSDACRPPAEDNVWTTPEFENCIAAALTGFEADAARFIERTRTWQEEAFDPVTGTLTWSKAFLSKLWKREDNLWMDKIVPNLSPFLNAPDDPDQLEAWRRFVRITPEGRLGQGDPVTLLELEVDAAGSILRFRTPTMQKAILKLLQDLCKHSCKNSAAADALGTFAGLSTEAVAALAPKDRAAIVFMRLMEEMAIYFTAAALEGRHARVSCRIAEQAPALVTVVEFEQQWQSRRLPTAPSGAVFEAVPMATQAGIFFDPELFQRVVDGDGRTPIPPVKVGTCGHEYAPKHSCLTVLRRRCDGMLFLVAAVHMESGEPSHSEKVAQRAHSLAALLCELTTAVEALVRAGLSGVVVVGGDFNGLREEYVFGNGEEFFSQAAVRACQPAKQRPQGVPFIPELTRASLGPSGELRLKCDALDGGELYEASCAKGCTRASATDVIDFIFVGSFGGLCLSASKCTVCTDEQAAACADVKDGARIAILEWGSDHLPVMCELEVAATSRGET